jgi:septal ring factor EnvC (AmiA/AmiB activator)
MAFQQTNKIQTQIEQQDVSLKSQRDEIERKLTLETKAFAEELNDVKSQVDKFKDNNNKKREEEYNKAIAKINDTLKALSKQMVHINEQEADLEATLSEYPQIEQCKKQIKPYQTLWEICRDWNTNKNIWQTSVLNTLNPDEVEKEHKRMRTEITRLVMTFD